MEYIYNDKMPVAEFTGKGQWWQNIAEPSYSFNKFKMGHYISYVQLTKGTPISCCQRPIQSILVKMTVFWWKFKVPLLKTYKSNKASMAIPHTALMGIVMWNTLSVDSYCLWKEHFSGLCNSNNITQLPKLYFGWNSTTWLLLRGWGKYQTSKFYISISPYFIEMISTLNQYENIKGQPIHKDIFVWYDCNWISLIFIEILPFLTTS